MGFVDVDEFKAGGSLVLEGVVSIADFDNVEKPCIYVWVNVYLANLTNWRLWLFGCGWMLCTLLILTNWTL